MYILPPHQLRAFQTIIVLYVIMNIPVTPLALMCNCFNLLSLQFVLVGGVSLWGIPVFIDVLKICFWSCFDLISLPLCVLTAAQHIRFLLVRVFIRFTSLCGVFP